MKQANLLNPTPWDFKTFGFPTWEIENVSLDSLADNIIAPGHYSLKVHPLLEKKILHDLGFYYCDTLIEPSCDFAKLRRFSHPHASISKIFNKNQALNLCANAFDYGRFHRDFNIPKSLANKRYENWLIELIEANKVYGLFWENDFAGFIGYDGNSLLLHAIEKKYRGLGMSKYWWSAVCFDLLEAGNKSIKSSISAANLPVLRLYSSLGFGFGAPLDVYHYFRY